MNKININKIAVKFDVENTTEELFDAVVNKFVELGYCGSVKDVVFDDLQHWNILLVDDDGDMLLANSYWSGLSQHITMSPQEFLEITPADNNTIIAEWLDKLQYVFNRDVTIRNFYYSTMVIETDFGDVYSAEEVVKFINRRYDKISNEENTQKKAKLEAKRQKLMDELSEIDQQLGLYK